MYYKEHLIREDGRLEWICKHGVGHTIDAGKEYRKALKKYWDSHGCDGCCKNDS